MKITSTAKDMKGFICEVTDLTDKAEHWESDRDVIVAALHGVSAKAFTATLTGTAISVLLRKPKMDKFEGTLDEALAKYFTATVKDTKAIEAKAAAKAKAESRLFHLNEIKGTVESVPKNAKKSVLKGFGFESLEDLQSEIDEMLNEISPEETDETKSASVAEMINYLSNRHPEKQSEYLKLSAEQLRALVETEAKTETET